MPVSIDYIRKLEQGLREANEWLMASRGGAVRMVADSPTEDERLIAQGIAEALQEAHALVIEAGDLLEDYEFLEVD